MVLVEINHRVGSLRVRRVFRIAFTWATIGGGLWCLVRLARELNLDAGRELALLVLLGMVAEWLAIPFQRGQLSGGFAVILATFCVHGTAAAAWVAGLSTFFGQGIVNRGQSMRTVMFNAAQYVLAVLGGHAAFLVAGGTPAARSAAGNIPALLAFTAAYMVVNHALVYLYTRPNRHHHPLVGWPDAFRWDLLTYIFATPIGLLMALVRDKVGLAGLSLLFLPVLATQFILRLYVELALTNRELAVLYEISRRLGRKHDAGQVVELVLRETRRVIPYHTGIIYLWSEEERCYRPGAVLSPHAGQIRGLRFAPEEGFLGEIVQTREPRLIGEARQDERVGREPGFPQFVRSAILVPLVVEEDVLGLFLVGERRPQAYDRRQLHTLTVIASQATVAIANAVLYRRLEHMAITDGLTGLYNHRYFYLRTQAEFQRAARQGETFAVVFFDLDHFKDLNDQYGHLAGDAVLAQLGEVIRRNLREGDVAARYGGEEFALLLPSTGEHRAVYAAERIREAVRRHEFSWEGRTWPVQVSISAGVAVFPKDGRDLAALLRAADRALYRAKEMGRDRVVTCNGGP
ncbi:MAG: GGDEF domain-containing protein [Firmicutes bacterium]|nr:GGDEF domain-containing protein [Bacillota bacterium]